MRRWAGPTGNLGLHCLLVAVFLFAMYGDAIEQWWTLDDPFHLHFLATHDLSYLWTPAIWRELPFRMFTPLQFLSYELDLALFGMSARAFYAHQLVALIAAIIATMLAFRRFVDPHSALLLALITAAVPPLNAWVLQLMTRHYVEGLMFAALAVYLRYDASDRIARLAPVAYLAAMLCKEVYVSLVVALLILERGSLERRIRTLTPFGIMLAAYLVGRWWMLGTLGGGYGWIIPPSQWLGAIVLLPVKAAVYAVPNGFAVAALSVSCSAIALELWLEKNGGRHPLPWPSRS